jgi:outer membrane immunogenic protein
MPRQLFATTAVVMILTSGTASAADVEMPVAPEWTGFYAGAHLGYGWSDWEGSTDPFIISENGPDIDADGFVGGLHLGYNYQIEQFVLGLEADVDYTDFDGDGSLESFDFGDVSVRNRWQGALVARAGVAFDDLLVYGLGGVALADAEVDFNGRFGFPSSSESKTHWGYTIGAGLEYMLDEDWSGRLEVRYTDFASKQYEMSDPNQGLNSTRVDWDQTVVTLGISRHF